MNIIGIILEMMDISLGSDSFSLISSLRASLTTSHIPPPLEATKLNSQRLAKISCVCPAIMRVINNVYTARIIYVFAIQLASLPHRLPVLNSDG